MQALFLGAGASYECGLPLAVELSKELSLWLTRDRLVAYNEVWREQGRGWDERVVARLAGLLGDYALNYEALLAALQDEYAAERDEGLRKDWYAAQLFVLQALYGLLLERQVKNYHYAKVALRDFKGIKALAEQNRPLWVFTTNQDCLVELLAAELFIPLKSGFRNGEELCVKGEQQPEKLIEFERLSAEEIANGEFEFFGEGEYGINLVKLNGSLDIFATESSEGHSADYVKLVSSSKTPDYYLQALLHLNAVNQELALSRDGVTNNESLLIDGEGVTHQWRKTLMSGIHAESASLSIPTDSPLFQLFASTLNEVEGLFCVGYGFGDARIDARLADWLAADSGRQLRIVNPEITDAPAALENYRAQIVPAGKKAGAGEFFMSMDGDFGSLLQRVQRTMRNKARTKLLEKLLDS